MMMSLTTRYHLSIQDTGFLFKILHYILYCAGKEHLSQNWYFAIKIQLSLIRAMLMYTKISGHTLTRPEGLRSWPSDKQKVTRSEVSKFRHQHTETQKSICKLSQVEWKLVNQCPRNVFKKFQKDISSKNGDIPTFV